MWGLSHSTLATTPLTVTGRLLSYSAAKEWCAVAGTAENRTDAIAAKAPEHRVFNVECPRYGRIAFPVAAVKYKF
jgi:hypothetical protein